MKGLKKEKLTQERLKEVLNYNPETGIFTRISNMMISGCDNGKGYLKIRVLGYKYYSHRLAWLYIYGYFPENDIDHINRNSKDNRILNLREVSKSCNLRNTGNQINNNSGIKGVSWFEQNKKWRAEIYNNKLGKTVFLGLYNNIYNAVCARLAGEQCLNWSNCDSTSPAFIYVQKMLNGENNV